MSLDQIKESFEESLRTKREFLSRSPLILDAAQKIIECLKRGRKILICGNGGSAADAQHIAAELVGRFKKERAALPAIALSTDSSFLSAWSNDYSFETVFQRQVQGLGQEGDVLLAISTSGNSKNVLSASREALAKKMTVIALTGNGGGKLREFSSICIDVPSTVTARIQECHILAYHVICELVDEAFS